MRLQLLFENIKDGRGFIESEAFGGRIPSFPEYVDISGPHKERNIIPDEEPPYYHVFRLQFPSDMIGDLSQSISNYMIGDGWYSLLWDSSIINIIIKGDVFRISRNSKQMPKSIKNKLINYGLPEVYIPYILSSPERW